MERGDTSATLFKLRRFSKQSDDPKNEGNFVDGSFLVDPLLQQQAGKIMGQVSEPTLMDG